MRDILHNQNGSVIIMVVFIFIVLCSFTGLVIDVSMITYTQRQLQNAVDLAALAAVQEVIDNPEQVENTAIDFAGKNGILPGEVTVSYPYQNDPNTVEVGASRTIELLFVSLLGINSNKTISARAAATAVNSFDYAIFSNSNNKDIFLHNRIIIDGNIHSNRNFRSNNPLTEIDGIIEAVGTITAKNCLYQEVFPYSPYKDLSYCNIEDYRSQATQYYPHNLTITSKQELIDDEIIFAEGSVTIYSHVSGKGKIIAGKDITFIGNDIIFGCNKDEITFLAGNNITFNGSYSSFSGIFYTYNGVISICASNSIIYGRVFANQINLAGDDNHIMPDDKLNLPGQMTYSLIE